MADHLDDKTDQPVGKQHNWQTDTPPTVCIPCPIQLSYTRGIGAKKKNGPTIIARLSERDKKLIENETLMLGMDSVGAFMRWCTVQTARELCRIRTGKKPQVDL